MKKITPLLSTVLLAVATSATAQETPEEPKTPEPEVDPALEAAQKKLEKTSALVEELTREMSALKTRVESFEKQQEEDDLEALRTKAASFVAVEEEKPTDPIAFSSGQRSLQAINPEISIMADGFAKFHFLKKDWSYRTPQDRNGAFLRVFGLHFQSNLDPFAWTKICIGVTPSGVGLGEGYMTWNSILPQVSLTIGKFRQQFGIINRWHAPGLDQFDYPLALTTILGPSGLAQTGLSLEWTMPPLIAHANLLTLQVTTGENGQLFSGSFFSIPSALLHLKNYYDITDNTYLELGLTGMAGYNHREGAEVTGDPVPVTLYDAAGNPTTFFDENGDVVPILTTPGATTIVDEEARRTYLAGVDLTVNWEPLQQAKYNSFTWRSELYYIYKEQAAQTDNPGGDPITALGAYSYIHYRLSEQWELGFRGDFTQPFARDNSDDYTWQIVPYINWWQSHWVRLRLHYAHTDGTLMERPDDRFLLQATWAVGPHKHERY